VHFRPLPGERQGSRAAPNAPVSSPAPAPPAGGNPAVFAPPIDRSVGSVLRNPAPPSAPRVTSLPAAPFKPVPPAAPPADSKAAVVALRNDAPVPVELRFDGFNGARDEQMTVAPGATFEIPIGPGDYRLRVVAHNASTDSTKAVFTSRKRYRFVVDGQRDGEGGALSLKLREPEIDG
jgi:hypothetical protein